jgi:fibronectin type 3 domain-containing protein
MKKALSGFMAFIMAMVMAAGSFQGLALTAAAVSAPAAPQNIMAVSATYSSVKISWSAVTGASGYEVYRYNPVTKTFQRLVAAKAVSYTSTGLTTGKAYTFKARAYKTVSGKNTYGGYSKTVTAKPVPAVPGAFKAAVAGITSIKLSWNAVSGASGYTIYRLNSVTKKYAPLKTVTALSYTNTGLSTGTTYTYKVTAYRTVSKVNVYGGYSAAAYAMASPLVPGGFKAEVTGSTSITLSWNAVTGASGYELYSYNPVTLTNTFIINTAVLSYSNAGLTTGTTYYYTVRAYKTAGLLKVYSVYSAPASATPVGSMTEGSVGKILASGKFTMKFDIQMDENEDGVLETVPVTYYVSGEKTAMKLVMDVKDIGPMDMTMLSTGTKYYILIPSFRAYVILSNDMGASLVPQFVANDPNTKYMGTTTVTYKGAEYLVETYSDGSITSEFFIKDGQLKRMEMTDNTGAVSSFENMSLSGAVDSTVFVIPFGYVDYTWLLGDAFG